VIWDFQSEEQRNRFVPAHNQITEEGQRLLGPEFVEANKKIHTFVMGWPYTDYVALGE
jgi:hypothetical protein